MWEVGTTGLSSWGSERVPGRHAARQQEVLGKQQVILISGVGGGRWRDRAGHQVTQGRQSPTPTHRWHSPGAATPCQMPSAGRP